MVRWVRWHCPPDTRFEIQTLEVWGRARYLSVTEVSHNTEFTSGWGSNICLSFKPPRPGNERRAVAWKAAVLTTTLGPPPCTVDTNGQLGRRRVEYVGNRGWFKWGVPTCISGQPRWNLELMNYLTLSGLNLSLSSSSTTSRELLLQFPTCSGWRWLAVGGKFKKIVMYW